MFLSPSSVLQKSWGTASQLGPTVRVGIAVTLVAAVSALGLALIPASVTTHDSAAWLVSLAALPVAAVLFSLCHQRSRRAVWISPVGLFLLFLWGNVLTVPIFWRVGLATPWDDLDAPPAAVVLAAVIVLSVATGLTAVQSQYEPRRVAFTAPGRALLVVQIGALVTGLVAVGLLFSSVGGPAELLENLASRRELLAGLGYTSALAMVPATVAFLTAMWSRPSPLEIVLGVLCALEALAFLFVSGSRFPMVALVLGLVVARAHHRRIRLAVVAVVVAGAAPFSVWYAVAVRGTSAGQGDGQAFGGASVTDFLRSVVDPFVFGGLDVIRTLGATIDGQLALLRADLGTWLAGFATVIPRPVWPGKPVGVSTVFAQQEFPDRWAAGTGVPPSILAEGVFLFGAIGGVIYVLALTFLIARVSRRIWCSELLIVRLLGIFATTDVIVLAKSGSDSFLRLAALHVVAAVLVAAVTHKLGVRAENQEGA